jgi:hypothetical protein
MFLQLGAHNSKNREDHLVNVDRVSRLRFLFEHSAKGYDDFSCTDTVPFDLIQRVAPFLCSALSMQAIVGRHWLAVQSRLVAD